MLRTLKKHVIQIFRFIYTVYFQVSSECCLSFEKCFLSLQASVYVLATCYTRAPCVYAISIYNISQTQHRVTPDLKLPL